MMKRLSWTMLLGLLLAVALGTSALAATAVAVDGKTYVFTGDATTYEADGKTFTFEGNTVRVREPGRADRVLPLEASEQAVLVEDVGAASYGAASDTSVRAGSGMAVEVAADTATIYEDSVSIEVSEAIATSSTELSEGTGDGSTYDDYAKFGLSHDQGGDALYYQGKRVRFFSDAYELDEFSYCAIEHYDPKGVVDVEAQRDVSRTVYNADGSQNPGGTLTGLRVLSDAEFAARDLSRELEPAQPATAVASEGEPMTAAEKQAMYAPYASLGLTYDAEKDRLYYEGQSVRRFLDVQQSNGESFSGGSFQGTMTSTSFEDGQVDVTITRDYQRPDAQGNGAITGIHAEDVK